MDVKWNKQDVLWLQTFSFNLRVFTSRVGSIMLYYKPSICLSQFKHKIATNGEKVNLSAQHSSSVESKNHLYVLEKSIDFPAMWKGLCSDSPSSVSYLYSLYPPDVDLHLSGCRSLSGQWTATTLTWIKNQTQPGSFCTLLFSVCQLWRLICCSGQSGFLDEIYGRFCMECHFHSEYRYIYACFTINFRCYHKT